MHESKTQTSMETLSSKDRVFYFHGFTYFLEDDLKNQYDWKPEGLVSYFCHLLLVFDRILIPAEHISLSASKQGERFKLNFLNIPAIQSLIESGLIVTSIWAQAKDVQQHLEASDRYVREIGATNSLSKKLLSYLPSIKSFQRDPGKQSKKAAEKLIQINDFVELGKNVDLSYFDGDFHIDISHEMLLLGDGKGKFSEEFIRDAKGAYISAMPFGNGRIYISSIDLLETFENQIGLYISNQDDFISPFCLTKKALDEIFIQKLSFPKLNINHFHSYNWVNCYQSILSEKEAIEFRCNLNKVLREVSMFLSGDLSSYLTNFITLHQTKFHNHALAAEGISGLIDLFEYKFARIVRFIGSSVDELSKKKRYYLSPHVRNSMIRIWKIT